MKNELSFASISHTSLTPHPALIHTKYKNILAPHHTHRRLFRRTTTARTKRKLRQSLNPIDTHTMMKKQENFFVYSFQARRRCFAVRLPAHRQNITFPSSFLFHLALRFLKNFIHSPARHRRLHVAQVRIAFLCCGAHVVRFPATVFIAAASRAVLRMREKNKLRSTLNLFSTMLWNASNFW